MKPNEIFNKIISREIPADILYENEHTLVFLANEPCSPGHTLVIPKKYSKNILDIDEADLFEIMKTVKYIAPVVLKAVGAEGYNLDQNNESVAGQVVFHTHFHIIPRFPDDGLEHWHPRPELFSNIPDLANKIKNLL
jgi:histidine triad (HIT) family protein